MCEAGGNRMLQHGSLFEVMVVLMRYMWYLWRMGLLVVLTPD